MTSLKMTRLTLQEAEDTPEMSIEFLENSPLYGQVVAVYCLEPRNGVSLYITEYYNGTFWTLAEREDIMGTLTNCVDFLLKHFQ